MKKILISAILGATLIVSVVPTQEAAMNDKIRLEYSSDLCRTLSDDLMKLAGELHSYGDQMSAQELEKRADELADRVRRLKDIKENHNNASEIAKQTAEYYREHGNEKLILCITGKWGILSEQKTGI